MLIDFEKVLELGRLRQQHPVLSFANVDLTALLKDILVTLFPELTQTPQWHFVRSKRLAFIVHGGLSTGGANIYINQILNRSDTPEQVFRQIFTHELLHLRIGPREVDGKMKSHPPEFWEAENQLFPEVERAWEWIFFNLGEYLIQSQQDECVRVRRNWRESLLHSMRHVPALDE